jgi:hypothetical protein
MTADSAATETTDELVEILAEAIYAARGYAGISKTDTGETRSVWASSLDYKQQREKPSPRRFTASEERH